MSRTIGNRAVTKLAACHLSKEPADTECGFKWTNLPQSCYVCNGGPHYHYGDGGCDTEPCRAHGGPE